MLETHTRQADTFPRLLEQHAHARPDRPAFREKDLGICKDMAARHGVQLPVVETTLEHYRQLVAQGYGDEDISTIFRLKDALFAPQGVAGKGPPRR